MGPFFNDGKHCFNCHFANESYSYVCHVFIPISRQFLVDSNKILKPQSHENHNTKNIQNNDLKFWQHHVSWIVINYQGKN